MNRFDFPSQHELNDSIFQARLKQLEDRVKVLEKKSEPWTCATSPSGNQPEVGGPPKMKMPPLSGWYSYKTNRDDTRPYSLWSMWLYYYVNGKVNMIIRWTPHRLCDHEGWEYVGKLYVKGKYEKMSGEEARRQAKDYMFLDKAYTRELQTVNDSTFDLMKGFVETFHYRPNPFDPSENV